MFVFEILSAICFVVFLIVDSGRTMGNITGVPWPVCR